MKLSESIPGKEDSTLEDVRTWGLYHINNLLAVMDDVLMQAPLITDGLAPAGKSRLSWVYYCMKDKLAETEECLFRYVDYVNALEKKVKALESGK